MECDGDALVVFNFHTLPAPDGLPPRLSRDFLLPWHAPFGEWLLGVRGNYAYAASVESVFFAELLRHGFFILPTEGTQIFSCPFPRKPYVFKLQEPIVRPGREQELAPGTTWRRCKMLRRYGGQFQISCNSSLRAHLQLCNDYHEARSGSWMSAQFIDAIMKIHEDSGNGIKVYGFELWEKSTGRLAAASFGLAIGTFFHDFSMCSLIKDRRSAGAILSKAIGALLTECGIQDWYWGCKSKYMADYEAHGAREISRGEYYARLRSAVRQSLPIDPEEALREGRAPIAPRPANGVGPEGEGI
mmetsp:Transcript_37257/g.107610  ORF Transcript_37257/g.107610 Transcript_37257/m.107610 type:complete len:301 (+) Transcript_37257:1-903(+)